MAQTPEAKVKAWLDKRLDQVFPGHYKYKPPGGMFGVAGTPDYFVLWGGVFIAIEVKADGNVLRANQLATLKKIKAAGGVSAVMVGKDERKLLLIYNEVMMKNPCV